MVSLSVVIPVFNEEHNIPRICASVEEQLRENNIVYELLFVDDGSQDGSWRVLQEMALANVSLKAVRLSKNFGKESAIFAGLKEAEGLCVAVMDCDGQHPPEILGEMYRLWHDEGFEVIEARKRSRGRESLAYKGFAVLFYACLRLGSHIDLANASDFKLLDRQVVDALNEMPERQTFFRALSSWTGFRSTEVFFDVQARETGKSKWSYGKLFRYALHSLTSFTTLPMQAVTVCGVLFFLFAVAVGLQTLYHKWSGYAAEGFSTVILLLLVVGSIIMFSLGIIGYYLAKIYEEVKFRPRYIIRERLKGRKGEEP